MAGNLTETCNHFPEWNVLYYYVHFINDYQWPYDYKYGYAVLLN
jgi:hypothetical protein